VFGYSIVTVAVKAVCVCVYVCGFMYA